MKKSGIEADTETIVLFCNLATWDEEKLIFKHNSPYSVGDNLQRETARQLDSPELDPKNIPLKKPMIRDGEYGRISLGIHNSIFIGGVCHELGHALGLPHCRERPDEAAPGTALLAQFALAHLSYGKGGNAQFKNFEFECEVKTAKSANPGIFIHTTYQEKG